jgi:integrase
MRTSEGYSVRQRASTVLRIVTDTSSGEPFFAPRRPHARTEVRPSTCSPPIVSRKKSQARAHGRSASLRRLHVRIVSGAPRRIAPCFSLERLASHQATIMPAVNFHILRHTYASYLAMAGVPMAVIARQLGHADTRMTEKHYAHLAPSYVAQTIRANFPVFGLANAPQVIPLSSRWG